MSYVKLSTYRDFRIKANLLQAADNQSQSGIVSVWKCYVYCPFISFCLVSKINQREATYIIFGHFRTTICGFRYWEL